MSLYKDIYLNGAGRTKKRYPSILPFKRNKDGKIKLALGKVYYRFGNKDSNLYYKIDIFSSKSNLKTYIKKYKINSNPTRIKGKRQGTNNINNINVVYKFYAKLRKIVKKGDKEESAKPMPTPSKRPAPAKAAPC
ncbi:uncharacterized protein P884DRAFT_277899 [Thermothelomyces heterothallicus CBS 202.75]|uniref:uncharacterized protein n=1 Tax=Thermothelomyces heterothallicus CBS 202.75 TaxID=1149848 RepID=UPI0037424343